MKILMSPMGTAGDLRPFVSLAEVLRTLGHNITLVVPINGETLCRERGLPYQRVDFDYRELVDTINNKPSIKDLIAVLDKEISAPYQVLSEMAGDADYLLGGARNYALQPISEKFGLPYLQVWHTPQVLQSVAMTPWRVNRHVDSSRRNAFYWRMHNLKENKVGQRFVNKHRQNLGLKPIQDYASLLKKNIILCADRYLAPVPEDVQSEYFQTDYWVLKEEGVLDPEVEAFLKAGPPPFFVSFGSMADRTGAHTVRRVKETAQALDMRAIIQKGWAGLQGSERGGRNLVIDNAPHHLLFPRVAAVVHHGGAGTTHTAAAAGVPQVLIPQYGDQFYWGARAAKLHLGPSAIPKTKLRSTVLQKAVQTALKDSEIREGVQKAASVLGSRESMEHTAQCLLQLVQKRL